MLMIGIARDVVSVDVADAASASIIIVAFPFANTTAIAKMVEASRRRFYCTQL